MNGIETSEADPPGNIIDTCTELLTNYYADSIATAVQKGAESVTIEYDDVFAKSPDLADNLTDHPRQILEAFRRAITDVNISPVSADDLQGLDVRITGVDTPEPIVSNLRADPHKDKYIGVRGQVSLATQVQPKLMEAMFKCERCSTSQTTFTVGPIKQVGEGLQLPHECPSCERQGPFTLLDSQSEYLDHQIVELTDPPGENPGQTGDVLPVHLYGELAGEVMAGDRIRINGIATTEHLTLNSKSSVDRRQPWVMLGHAIDEEETAFEDVEPERVEEIKRIPEEHDVQQAFIDSFAPEILTGDRGDKHKLAAILALFGGNSRNDRDDINVFYIGDAGTGKSHLLDRAKTLAPKAVEASGKGATAAGLTATATKSEHSGKWMLEAGALVLANGGVACIDEFDKMADSARQSMHEAMENQRIPINKAGINATLTTETTVIAAANPKNGTFDRFTPVNEQVDLGSPLLSRFDLIFGMMDAVDEDRDEQIAKHQHRRIESDVPKLLDDELMREYIAYARQNYDPMYSSDEPLERLVEYYVETRSKAEDSDDSVMPITPRVNDALRRIAQASARLHLRNEITMEDAETAIELMDMRLGDTALEPDGTLNAARMEGRQQTQAERVQAIKNVANGDAKTPEEIAEMTGIAPSKVLDELELMHEQGDAVEPEQGKYRVL